ncbi:MAG: hypothetical protein GY762_16120 [Proteobacteria bacterium]|nr:hypothetical protein [Pseudomonadota bacterium]
MVSEFKQESGIRLDISQWPVVIISPASSVMDQSIQDFMDNYFELIKGKKERYASIIDLSQRTNMTKSQRKILIDGMNKYGKFTRQYRAGTAVVFSSAVIRSILMSVFWLFEPGYPTEIFKTTAEALDWCRNQLDI